MRTGKLNISRGRPFEGEGASEPRLSLVPRTDMLAAPDSSPAAQGQRSGLDFQQLNDRLTALERLAALRSSGLLTEVEYAAEKALVRAVDPVHPSGPVPHRTFSSRRPVGPSLLGRLFSLKLIAIGLVAGLALSFSTQPRQTMRWLEQALALLGA